jgi:hypothetical protein
MARTALRVPSRVTRTSSATPSRHGLALYLVTVVLPFVPTALLWAIVWFALHKALGWSDVFGKGELLYVAIPISTLALSTMTLTPSPHFLRTLLYGISLSTINAGATAWLIVFVVLKAYNQQFDDGAFIPGSAGFFLCTAGLGMLAVATRR